MKATVKMPVEVEIRFVLIEVAVRYEEEDIPNDFPKRHGEMWRAYVDIDTGQISEWPAGKSGNLHMKVCDSGSYCLIGEKGNTVAKLENEYVPHGVVPGEYGDYIDLKIDATGRITNWPKKPDISRFFQDEE